MKSGFRVKGNKSPGWRLQHSRHMCGEHRTQRWFWWMYTSWISHQCISFWAWFLFWTVSPFTTSRFVFVRIPPKSYGPEETSIIHSRAALTSTKSMNDEQCACAEHHWLYIIWHVLYWEVGHMHWCRPLINWPQEEVTQKAFTFIIGVSTGEDASGWQVDQQNTVRW